MPLEFKTIERSGVLCHLRPGWEDWVDEIPLKEVWRLTRGCSMPVRAGDRAVRIKKKSRGGFLGPLLPDLYPLRMAQTLLDRYSEAERRGLPTARLVGTIVAPPRASFVRLAVMTEEVPDSTTLAEIIAAGRAREPDMRTLGDRIRILHLAGLLHGDLNAMNMVTPSPDRPYVFLDFDDATYFAGPVPEALARRDIVRLARSIAKIHYVANQSPMYPHLNPLSCALFEGYAREDPVKILLLRRWLAWAVWPRRLFW